MSHPDDGRLHALVDGELTSAEVAELDAHCRKCSECRARLEEARVLLGESDRLVAVLELPPRAATRAPVGARRDHRMLGLAASALLVVTVGWLAMRRPGEDREALESPLPRSTADQATAAPAPAEAEPPSVSTAPPGNMAPLAKDGPAPAVANESRARREVAEADESRQEAKQEEERMSADADKQIAGAAGRIATQGVRADTPPAPAKEGVPLNDLPTWKPRVAAPAAPPASARFRLDGLDVVSSTALAEGGIRLGYSVNGTPVEFDQQPGTSAPLQRKPDAAMHELEWIQDGMRLTLRSTLPAAELERLRQHVR